MIEKKCIYHEVNVVRDFFGFIREMQNKLNKNNYIKKDNFCNYDKLVGNEYDGISTDKIVFNHKKMQNYNYERSLVIASAVDFFSEEIKKMSRAYLDKSNIEAVHIKVEIPYLFAIKENHSRIKKVCNKLITNLKPNNYKLPYFAILIGEANKIYLNIVYIDRQYYAKPKEVITYNKKTLYKIKGKGYNITKENALSKGYKEEDLIRYEPGSIETKRTVYWSAKTHDMWFGARSVLEAKRNFIKTIIYSIFKSFNITLNTFRDRFIKRVGLYRYNSKSCWQAILHNKMYWWLYRKNNAINALIEEINTLYLEGNVEEDSKDDINHLINKILKNRLNSNLFENVIKKLMEHISNSVGVLDISALEDEFDYIIHY